jgi:hypothetical protein
MMRKGLLLLALLALSGLGLAQRAVSFRLSLPPAGLGVGLEAPLERNLAFRGYGDLFPSGPSFLLAGEVLFKPDLGQVDRDLKGIRPYFGGGLGVLHPRERRRSTWASSISLGVEVLLGPSAPAFFVDGEYFSAFGGRRFGRTVIGANLR